MEFNAEAVGLSIEEPLQATEGEEKVKEEEGEDKADGASQKPSASEPASVKGQLIRFARPPVTVTTDGKAAPPYDEDEDPTSSRKQNIEKIVRQDGLAVYKDQAGRLWTGLAFFWMRCAEFTRANQTFETGIASILTIRDFTHIFDSYAESSETVIKSLMAILGEEADEDDDEEVDKEALEKELDEDMKEFEDLMDRRPFFVNDVLLRRNPHDVQEWERRVTPWGDDDEKVLSSCAADFASCC